jgi:hypothetical protein
MYMSLSSLLGRMLVGVSVFASCGPVGAAFSQVSVTAFSGEQDVVKHLTGSTGVSLSGGSSSAASGEGSPDSTPVGSYATSAVAAAKGSVGPGYLRLYATALAKSATSYSQGPAVGQAAANGQFTDYFLVSAPGCAACSTGSRGYLQFAVVFDGTNSSDAFVDPTGSNPDGDGGSSAALAFWSSKLLVESDGVASVSLVGSSVQQIQNGKPSADFSTGASIGRHVLGMEFFFGRPFSMQWYSEVSVTAVVEPIGTEISFSGHASAVANFSNTFVWDGITGLLDANGNPVASFTALSPDGVSYVGSLAPVPEPGAWSMLLAGLAALCLRRNVRGRLNL